MRLLRKNWDSPHLGKTHTWGTVPIFPRNDRGGARNDAPIVIARRAVSADALWRKAPKQSKNGFTFIELIVAITIFSIIAVSVYSVLRAGLKLWLKTNPLIQANQANRFFFDMISRDLKNAVAYYASTDKDNANFLGSPKKISFMALIDASKQEEGRPYLELAKVTYYFDAAAKTVKRSVATKLEGLDETAGKITDILNNIKGDKFAFQYCYKDPFGASEDTYSYEWADTWSEEFKLKMPRGVKIEVGSYTKTVFIPTGDKLEAKK